MTTFRSRHQPYGNPVVFSVRSHASVLSVCCPTTVGFNEHHELNWEFLTPTASLTLISTKSFQLMCLKTTRSQPKNSFVMWFLGCNWYSVKPVWPNAVNSAEMWKLTEWKTADKCMTVKNTSGSCQFKKHSLARGYTLRQDISCRVPDRLQPHERSTTTGQKTETQSHVTFTSPDRKTQSL